MGGNLFWQVLAWLASRSLVTRWLIARSARTPYLHIGPPENRYMERFWLFNPYSKDAEGNAVPARWKWLPSIRLHHICREDIGDHMHDHPWNARTIILRGFYFEQRPALVPGLDGRLVQGGVEGRMRRRGFTGRLLFGEYHHISHVSIGGVWTLFFTWPDQGTWGFLVDGQKVPHKEYRAAKDRDGYADPIAQRLRHSVRAVGSPAPHGPQPEMMPGLHELHQRAREATAAEKRAEGYTSRHVPMLNGGRRRVWFAPGSSISTDGTATRKLRLAEAEAEVSAHSARVHDGLKGDPELARRAANLVWPK